MTHDKMDTLGFEPRAFRMRSGCDTTTPCALEKQRHATHLFIFFCCSGLISSIAFVCPEKRAQGKKTKCRDPGSSRGPSDLQSDALPTELSRQLSSTCCRTSAVMLQPPTPLHLLQLPLSSDARCPLPWTISSSLALTCLPSLAPDFPHGADVCRSEQTAAESPQP